MFSATFEAVSVVVPLVSVEVVPVVDSVCVVPFFQLLDVEL
jgi:hypothetical protein